MVTQNERQRAKHWRESHGWTFDALAELTGFGPRIIRWYEIGLDTRNLPLKPWLWHRYKRICGDIDAEIHGRKKGKAFDWEIVK